MKNRRDFLASIGAATALGGCDMPAPRRPYPFRNGRGLSFNTVRIDNLGRTCAVGFLAERPGGQFQKRIALFNLEALSSQPGRPLVAESVQGEPGFLDSMPLFGESGSDLFFARVFHADLARSEDRAATRIIRHNLKSGTQETVLEVPTLALPKAEFQVGGDSYLIYSQAIKFIEKGAQRGYATRFAVRTVRLGGEAKGPALGYLHNDFDYTGEGIAVPGIGYLVRGIDRGEDKGDRYRFSALSLDDIRSGSIRNFSNFEKAIEYLNNTMIMSTENQHKIRKTTVIYSTIINYPDIIGAKMLARPPKIQDWKDHLVYDYNLYFGISLKSRSVLDDEVDLQAVPLVKFAGNEIPMSIDVIGSVNFLPFIDSSFPTKQENDHAERS